MSLFEALSLAVIVVLSGLGLALLLLVLRNTRRSAAGELVGYGDFSAALDSADLGPAADRDELLAAAFAAKHILDLGRAEELAARALALDREDGEAWLEVGLIRAYSGDHTGALEALSLAARHRADLLESISLHRAWVSLRDGDALAARRLFEEVSAPLESKLRSDLGPGDPLFAEWFFQAADLWEESGARDKGEWARLEARSSAPNSRLVAAFS